MNRKGWESVGSSAAGGLVEALLQKKVPKESDLELIRAYFSGKEEIDLERFRRENRGEYLEVAAVDKSQGYLFFYELQIDRNHEARMESELLRQRKLGKYIERKFTDYPEGISGFHWSWN